MKSCFRCRRDSIVAALIAAFFFGGPAAAQMNSEIMQKWAAVKVVHYTVTGTYAAETLVVPAGTNGLAEVKDRVELSFDWDQTESKLVGEPAIKNFPTEIGALRNGASGCRAPTLKGPYEHATVLSLADGLGGQLALSVRRDYPAADMPRVCTGAAEQVPVKSLTEQQEFVVPGVMLLAMPAQPGALKIAPDGKSMIFVSKGWTWTYTPTPGR